MDVRLTMLYSLSDTGSIRVQSIGSLRIPGVLNGATTATSISKFRMAKVSVASKTPFTILKSTFESSEGTNNYRALDITFYTDL